MLRVELDVIAIPEDWSLVAEDDEVRGLEKGDDELSEMC